MLFRHFDDAEKECYSLLNHGNQGDDKIHLMVHPAYDYCIKASHIFNLLNARGVISVTERQNYILRVRSLSKKCGEAYLRTIAGDSMFELLLEIFSEEIPARMQNAASEHLKKSVCEKLTHNGLTFGDVQAFYTPRRLTLVIAHVPAQAQDITEEKRGPRVDAPVQAIEGFLKSTAFALEDLEKRETDKGTFYYANLFKKGRSSTEIIAEFMPDLLKNFPWQKSMRWGDGDFIWVRPLHSMICILSDKTQTHIVPFEVGGIKTNDKTQGHRFMASDVFSVENFSDYQQKLRHAKVILSQEDRKDMIVRDMEEACKNINLELIADDGLLAEVVGLVEYPVILMGDIASEFQTLPPEVLKTSMRTHQKFFSVKCPKTQKIVKFITIANCESLDGGKMIVDGNQRVLTARLSDAKYFYETDLKKPLVQHAQKLESITYHAKLGSQAKRIARLQGLAEKIAPLLGIDADLASYTASLIKADLTTEMVGEFPELQGIMGGYYALAQGENPETVKAISEHYRPIGASDNVPSSPLGICLALADRFDQLAGFWLIDEKPTGSKDPFALRRAALGIIRIILDNDIHCHLSDIIHYALEQVQTDYDKTLTQDLKSFFFDRLKVNLRDKDIPHDVISALLGVGETEDIMKISQNARLLKDFLSTEEGQDVLAGYRRAVNILRIEEKKDGQTYHGDVGQLTQSEEINLYNFLKDITSLVQSALEEGEFAKAMLHLQALRTPINAFFDNVIVNDDDITKRYNRLHLLAKIRHLLHHIADFSVIQ